MMICNLLVYTCQTIQNQPKTIPFHLLCISLSSAKLDFKSTVYGNFHGNFIISNSVFIFLVQVTRYSKSAEEWPPFGEYQIQLTTLKKLVLGCPRKLGSMVRINGLWRTYKWGINWGYNQRTNHLLTSWDIQVDLPQLSPPCFHSGPHGCSACDPNEIQQKPIYIPGSINRLCFLLLVFSGGRS